MCMLLTASITAVLNSFKYSLILEDYLTQSFNWILKLYAVVILTVSCVLFQDVNVIFCHCLTDQALVILTVVLLWSVQVWSVIFCWL